MDRMASMAAFTKVVGVGSFSAAAREMQVSGFAKRPGRVRVGIACSRELHAYVIVLGLT